MRKILLAANWKMNGNSSLLTDMAAALAQQDKAQVDVAVCPPFVLLPQAQQVFAGSDVGYGAQDVSDQDKGAFTGQISAGMLNQLACQYVIIGHSERRAYCGEHNQLIAEKTRIALQAGLTAIVCVGEDAQQKQQGQTEQVVLEQLQAVLAEVPSGQLAQLVIAYEPIWAIGTGQAAQPEEAEQVHALLRACIAKQDATAAQAVRILYGGSANATNIEAFVSQTNIDGALIGGASLEPELFTQMIAVASQVSQS